MHDWSAIWSHSWFFYCNTIHIAWIIMFSCYRWWHTIFLSWKLCHWNSTNTQFISSIMRYVWNKKNLLLHFILSTLWYNWQWTLQCLWFGVGRIVIGHHLYLFLKIMFQHTNDFALYTEAIKFFNHSESMVRIAVRTITLNVYKGNNYIFM